MSFYDVTILVLETITSVDDALENSHRIVLFNKMSNAIKDSQSNMVTVIFRLHHLPEYAKKLLKATYEGMTTAKVALLGSIQELGDWELGRHLFAKPSSCGKDVWEVTADVPACSNFEVSWLVADSNNKVLFWDPAQDHGVQVSHHKTMVQVSWSRDPTYCSSRTCTLVAQTHYICQSGEILALLGSDPCLGEWNPEECQRAYEFPRGSGNWQATIQIAQRRSYNWKWAVVEETTREVLRWEECPERFVFTNCERIVLRASWNCPSSIQEHSDMIFHHSVDMKKVSRFYDAVENSESLMTKEMVKVTRSWKQRRETGEQPVVVTEVERALRMKETERLKSRRSMLRKIGRAACLFCYDILLRLLSLDGMKERNC